MTVTLHDSKRERIDEITWEEKTQVPRNYLETTSETQISTSSHSRVTTTEMTSTLSCSTICQTQNFSSDSIQIQEVYEEPSTDFAQWQTNASEEENGNSEEPQNQSQTLEEEPQSQSNSKVSNYTYGSWDEYYNGLYNCDTSVHEDQLHGLTEWDIILLRRIVSSEYGGAFVSVYDKACVVASTVNQLRSGKYGSTILECLNISCTPWGFNPYYEYTIDQSIVDAVDYYFENRDTVFSDWPYCGWSGWGYLTFEWPNYDGWPNDYMFD